MIILTNITLNCDNSPVFEMIKLFFSVGYNCFVVSRVCTEFHAIMFYVVLMTPHGKIIPVCITLKEFGENCTHEKSKTRQRMDPDGRTSFPQKNLKNVCLWKKFDFCLRHIYCPNWLFIIAEKLLELGILGDFNAF